jgi:hypothetical protein
MPPLKVPDQETKQRQDRIINDRKMSRSIPDLVMFLSSIFLYELFSRLIGKLRLNRVGVGTSPQAYPMRIIKKSLTQRRKDAKEGDGARPDKIGRRCDTTVVRNPLRLCVINTLPRKQTEQHRKHVPCKQVQVW